jgi:osmotically-inducible protein OsmY
MASCSYKIALFLVFGLVLVTGTAHAQHPAETPPYVDQQTNPDERKLEQDIMSDLRKDPQMAYSRLTVQASDTEVIITGIVLTDTAKDHAIQIATQHAQGRKVTNRIRVNSNLNPGPGF